MQPLQLPVCFKPVGQLQNYCFSPGKAAVSQENAGPQVLLWLPWQFASKQPLKNVTAGKEMVSF